jgi:hypothetical protein
MLRALLILGSTALIFVAFAGVLDVRVLGSDEPSVDQPSTDGEFWPAFVATYETTDLQEDGSYRVIRYELDYESRSSWTRTTLADSSAEFLVGSVESWDGQLLTTLLPGADGPVIAKAQPGQIYAPGPWLVLWEFAGMEVASDRGRMRTYVREWQSSCVDLPSAACPDTSPVDVHQRVTVDLDSRIPQHVSSQTDEVVLSSFDIIELSLGD